MATDIDEVISVLEDLKSDFDRDCSEEENKYADVSQTIYYLKQKYK